MEPIKLSIPYFNGKDYGYWKALMRAYLKSIDEGVWLVVIDGYTPPRVVVEGVSVDKRKVQWTKENYKELK